MDFLTIVTYVAAVVETATLLGALVFATRAMKAEKGSKEKKDQKKLAVIFMMVYLVLNFIRIYGYGLK